MSAARFARLFAEKVVSRTRPQGRQVENGAGPVGSAGWKGSDLGMGPNVPLSPIPDSDPFRPADHSDQLQQFLLLPQEQTHGPCLRKQT